MEKTFFISFEGIDGSGKDTQLHNLIEIIREDNNKPFGNKYSNVWVTREPTKITKAGQEISKAIRERNVSGEEAAKLFVEDRKQHTKIIKEVLKHSHILISRYDLSTLAYQMTQDIDFETLYEMHKYNEEEGCIEPDLTLVFDLDVETAFKRMSKRESDHEIYEEVEFQKELQKNQEFCIEALRKKGRNIIKINSNQSIEEVTKEMVEKISQSLIQK